MSSRPRGVVWARRLGGFLWLGLLLVAPMARPQQEASVQFNFDNAEIRPMVRLVGELTGRRFVIDERVAGKVTVVTPARVPLSEVYPLFLAILQSNGFTVVEQDEVSLIVPLPGGRLPAPPMVLDGQAAARGGLATRVTRLEHVSSVEVAKVLASLVPGGAEGAVTAFASTNHLIVTSTADMLQRVESLVRELDKPGSARSIEVQELAYASPEDVAAQLQAAMGGHEGPRQGVQRHLKELAGGGVALPGDAFVVPAPQASSLLMIGTPAQMNEMKRIVALLDREPPRGSGRYNAIFLNYLPVEEAAKALNALLDKGRAAGEDVRISLEPNVSNNALLVAAAPRDFEWIRGLVMEIDRIPQQVLVEVLIAEVQEGAKSELGVEWQTTDAPGENRTTAIGRSRPGEADLLSGILETGFFPQGFTIGVATDVLADGTPVVPFLLRAFGEDRDIKILSRVPLWAQNNREAQVSVVDNIPILRSVIQGGSGTARDVIQNIDRMDVGIKLTFTPHVNPEGEVTIELNPSIEAITDEGPADQPFTPTISKREVSTTVTVPDGATIVISGLVREDRIKVVSKIPLLGDLPVLGVLFRSTRDQKQRTNLLIFVTPHIVTDMGRALEQKLKWEGRTTLRAEGMLEPDQGPEVRDDGSTD